jgi:hypothetical protein
VPTALVSTEIVVGALLVLVALVVCGIYARRRYISRGTPLTLCGLRTEGDSRWRLGLIRFGEHALEWHTLGGVSLRPRHCWPRQSLLLETPVPLLGAEAIAVLPGAQGVTCTSGTDVFELGLPDADYTALRSWQEASPPGYSANVA